MLNNFNHISPYYRFLSRLVFGNSILSSQLHLLKYLPPTGRMAIIGGGNGEILNYIYQQAPTIEILFVEASSGMISKAKKLQHKKQKVSYLHNSTFELEDFCPDLIFLPYILDMYDEQEIYKIVHCLIAQSQKNTKWFVSDFSKDKISNGTWFNKLRLKLSIIFFKITTGHRLSYLPDIFNTLGKAGLKSLEISKYESSFLKASPYISD